MAVVNWERSGSIEKHRQPLAEQPQHETTNLQRDIHFIEIKYHCENIRSYVFDYIGCLFCIS